MAITSESQMIDIVTISKGCTLIEEAAEDYTTSAQKVHEASEICTAKVLSVEGKSMQPTLRELSEAISSIKSNITYFTAQIRSVAQQIYATQLDELNKYKESQLAASQTSTQATTSSSYSQSPQDTYQQAESMEV